MSSRHFNRLMNAHDLYNNREHLHSAFLDQWLYQTTYLHKQQRSPIVHCLFFRNYAHTLDNLFIYIQVTSDFLTVPVVSSIIYRQCTVFFVPFLILFYFRPCLIWLETAHRLKTATLPPLPPGTAQHCHRRSLTCQIESNKYKHIMIHVRVDYIIKPWIL